MVKKEKYKHIQGNMEGLCYFCTMFADRRFCKRPVIEMIYTKIMKES